MREEWNGTKINWNEVEKYFNEFVPKGYYNPFDYHEVNSGKWIVDLSERSTGKTTNVLLLGMVLHKMYGTTICYIRETNEMIMPKHCIRLFETIKEFGYIEKITNGRYNTVKYRARQFFYYNNTNDEIDDDPILTVLSLDENFDNKSSLNVPRGDLIIFDEFISDRNYQNEFILLCDTIKTIIRERDTPIIWLLANTIDKHNYMFKELGIYLQIQNMRLNETKIITNECGTVVDVAFIGHNPEDIPEHRKRHNAKFFGFANPKLNSIRGGDWATKIYPHCPRVENAEYIIRNRYIRFNGFLLNLEFMKADDLGLFVNIHVANHVYDDSQIWTLDNQLNKRNEHYFIERSKLGKIFVELKNDNKVYYATNLEGSLVETYFREFKQIK